MTIPKTINVRMVVDVCGALEADTLAGYLYMIDDNRLGGSRNEATAELATAVTSGDRIIWTLLPIECETHAAVRAIELPAETCKVERNTYRDSDVSYWVGLVKQPVGNLPYGLTLELGSRTHTVDNGANPRLIEATLQMPPGPTQTGSS
ncbi:hypothetical protein [Sinorhizobium alkalisoli]|uniref:Uncharacterized protein n=1 Tax=Sinorhizobium alkalisoli TaxID=1752398 RepID=A0A1E3VIT7_9HYPH|nr:hypothetical protein [Sinorhizobium alkalisoli]MCG5480824.1 hypothetical protein [Sinorhizobium alkalisoli]ODR93201.1 hypothetical protein A8M32_01100 [Sinorhizobium alkalisoli]QFI70526.1 hypothetical protein EKH55_5652 [Sinorhizobium alkalisoli]